MFQLIGFVWCVCVSKNKTFWPDKITIANHWDRSGYYWMLINCLFVIVIAVIVVVIINILTLSLFAHSYLVSTEYHISFVCIFFWIGKAFSRNVKNLFSDLHTKNQTKIESDQWAKTLLFFLGKEMWQESTRTLSLRFSKWIEKKQKIGGTQSIKMSYQDMCVCVFFSHFYSQWLLSH